MKLSVITPVYNREDCISRCIESIIKNLNDSISIEHIIIDDGSTDSTPTIVSQYSKQYKHIKYFRFIENKGTNAARNQAISIATGDYCIILDSDDYFLDGSIAFIVETINKFSSFNYFMFSPDDMEKDYNSNPKLSNYHNILSYEDFLLGKVSGDFIHVIPIKVAKEVVFNEFIRIYEGVFFLMYYKIVRAMLFTRKVVVIRERNRTDSVSKLYIQTRDEYIRNSIISKKIFMDFFSCDLFRLEANKIISKTYIELIKDHILLSEYSMAKKYMEETYILHQKLPINLMLLYYFRAGKLYKFLIRFYLLVKYYFK